MIAPDKQTDLERDGWPDGDGPLRIEPEAADKAPLIIDVDGFEGPLDLLLDLSRRQKVDLTKISILALAEQYLEFIHAAKRMQLELAADYLVMAAWLAYLKSRLLVPEEDQDDEELSAEELSAMLAFRLQRLQAMRDAAAQLMARKRLSRDVFQRGSPEPLVIERTHQYADGLYDLLRAYAERRQKNASHRGYQVQRRPVWSMNEAKEALNRLLGTASAWSQLDIYLVQYVAAPEQRRSVMASGFAASLEMAREGKLELRQDKAFAALYLRPKGDALGA